MFYRLRQKWLHLKKNIGLITEKERIKERDKLRIRKWRKDNPEKAKYVSTPESRKYSREYGIKWRKKNPEKAQEIYRRANEKKALRKLK